MNVKEMTDKEILKLIRRLRLSVKEHLERCDPVATPKVYERLQQNLGSYRAVEDVVILLIIHNGLTPGAAIACLEMELP